MTRNLAIALAMVSYTTLGESSLLRAHAATKPKMQVLPPPAHSGLEEAPEHDDDGAYNTHEAACAACKYWATGSCAMYQSCICYSSNPQLGKAGGFGDTDLTGSNITDAGQFHWACGPEGGENYELCFKVDPKYEDVFGDKIDPLKPKCVEQ